MASTTPYSSKTVFPSTQLDVCIIPTTPVTITTITTTQTTHCFPYPVPDRTYYDTKPIIRHRRQPSVRAQYKAPSSTNPDRQSANRDRHTRQGKRPLRKDFGGSGGGEKQWDEAHPKTGTGATGGDGVGHDNDPPGDPSRRPPADENRGGGEKEESSSSSSIDGSNKDAGNGAGEDKTKEGECSG